MPRPPHAAKAIYSTVLIYTTKVAAIAVPGKKIAHH
jgi:hypothetical protein